MTTGSSWRTSSQWGFSETTLRALKSGRNLRTRRWTRSSRRGAKSKCDLAAVRDYTERLTSLSTSDSSRLSFASQVDAAVAKAGEAPVLPDFPPDAEDWLNVDTEGLDAVLEGSRKQPQQGAAQDSAGVDKTNLNDSPATEDQIATEQTARLRDLAQKVEDFVDGKGDLEGAVFSE